MAYITIPKKKQPAPSGGSSGGGGMGGLIGAAAAAAVLASGGAAAPAVIGAAGTGASLGSMLGSTIAPPSAPTQEAVDQGQGGVQPQTGAIQRKLDEVQSAPLFALHEAKSSLQSMPLHVQKEYAPYLDDAIKQATTLQPKGVA